MTGMRILLIVGGGIAAYKALELVRLLRREGASVRAVLTEAGSHFVTPLSLQALTEDKVHGDLFSLTDESEMGHIRLTREADLVVVAPATADLIARMAAGLAGDLAGAVLLASDKGVLIAPAMNHRMWHHAATQRNLARLVADGVAVVGPGEGNMACGEFGMGRMAEPADILAAIHGRLGDGDGPRLAGCRALVTSGPTVEAIDPVRFIANRSSGKQGHAIAAALARLGADVTLVSGPTQEPDPAGVRVRRVTSAIEMLAACQAGLPVDVAVCAAAVSDWRVAKPARAKIKKNGKNPPTLALVENPDILATLAKRGPKRPTLVVGFAAETENLIANARAKRRKKGCDWIVANDVSAGTETFGGETNAVHLVTDDGVETWEPAAKTEIARRLAASVAEYLARRGAP
ncbi:MAG: bifunctional phosphopantothenoylcysteine decarboxylase/phosphopantothenate--cysteine ligase CoaBC [Alphaproteobacteria bacterium]|nr:bifunctional phosphopantothenoylcysteine decarboxylase/phosphopantothenate--cysteine ligase CoaBC [Alphaproteobacteria bacterium]